MLTLTDNRRVSRHSGRTRREFLRIGGFSLGGLLGSSLASSLSLPSLLAAKDSAAVPHFVKDRSVVLLFLNGGPSHIESFDPKMTAPSEIRSIFGETPTSLPGVSFGAHFPKLASRADRLTIVRSYGSGNGGHTYQGVASGGNRTGATMGSLYGRVVGTNHPRLGIPTNVLVVPEAIDEELKLASNFETGALPTLTDPGDLGETYRAFDPRGGGQLKSNMQMRISLPQFEDRQSLLKQLDQFRRAADRGVLETTDHYQQQAFDIITRGVADAFDWSKEDPATIEKYDTTHLFDQREVSRWHDMKRASNLLGKQMLLARRLCEAGCGFVTVSDCGWDHHSNNNSPRGLGGFAWLGPQVDHAVAAFMDDVRDRGLEDRILLIVTGEMGRTPRINNNGGRDHYGELTPLLLFGGGLDGGRVLGQSDKQISKAVTRPYRPEHLMATVMDRLFDRPELRLARDLPRKVVQAITDNDPIV